MHPQRYGLALSLALVIGAQSACATEAGLLQAPQDLRQDGAHAVQRGQPVILLFSLPDCAYCEVVRRNYLAPLLRDTGRARQPVIREINIIGSTQFIGFGGTPTTEKGLAENYRVRLAPTVLVTSSTGELLAPPIVGGDTTGFYGGYLDNALAEARRKLHESEFSDSKGRAQ